MRKVIVLVHGYEGSGPDHWQRLLEQELITRGVPHLFPDLPDPLNPDKDRWIEHLAGCIDQAASDPVSFICHSLGGWAVDHLLAEQGPAHVHAVLLVAPPSPYLLFDAVQTFLPPPLSEEAWAPIAARSLLVAADDDDYASTEEHGEIARALKIQHRILPGGGHVNAEAGFGPWDLPLEWLTSVGALDP